MNGQSVRTVGLLVVLASLTVFLASLTGAACGEDDASERLATRVLEAKDSYAPVDDERIHRARRELAAASRSLNAYLTPRGTNGAAWKTYLGWGQLQEQARSDVIPKPNALAELHRRFTADYEGLEIPRFSRVARALRGYSDLARARAVPNPEQRYRAQLDELAERLPVYLDRPTQVDRWSIARRLGWLEQTNQVPGLVQAVRQQLSRQNLWVQISRRFVSLGINRPVHRVRPVRDNILGTRISGTGRTTGSLQVRFVPNDHRAVFETVFLGQTATDTVGSNGPVRIYSNGCTQFTASKRIMLDEHGLTSAPSSTQATTRTKIRGLSTNRGGLADRFIRKAAWKRVRSSQGQAQLIAARHAEARISGRLDQESGARVADANMDFLTRFRNPLLRRNVFPRQLVFRTSANRLFVQALQANRNQLGAPDLPPPLVGSHDLAVRVHESTSSNLLEGLIGGRRFTDGQTRARALAWFGDLPEKLESTKDEEPWSITFANQSPITVAFSDGEIAVTIRGQSYTSGSRRFRAMNITARYRIELSPPGARLTRQEDLEILPPGFDPSQDRLSASQVALRRLVSRRLSRVFEPQIQTQGLKLQGPWGKAGPLLLNQVHANQGWLTMAWSLPPQGVHVAMR